MENYDEKNCCKRNCQCPHSKHKSKSINKKKNQKKKVRKISSKSKRLQQMSIRPVHYLILSKIRYKNVLSKSNLVSLDRQIEQSLKTIKNSNAKQILEQIFPKKKQQKKTINWKNHENWLKQNAQPKHQFKRKSKKKLKRKKRYRSVSQRILSLAKPRYQRKKFSYDSMHAFKRVKRSALPAQVSHRIIELSKALQRFQRGKYDYDHSVKSTVTENALMCEPSKRILSLAVPRKYEKEKLKPMTLRGISLAALKYTLKDRTMKLSEPKKPYFPPEDPNDIVIPNREYTQYGVVQDALKYKASEKILNISTPRIIHQPIVLLPDDKPRTKHNVVLSALKYKPSKRILHISKPREIKSK